MKTPMKKQMVLQESEIKRVNKIAGKSKTNQTTPSNANITKIKLPSSQVKSSLALSGRGKTNAVPPINVKGAGEESYTFEVDAEIDQGASPLPTHHTQQ